MNPLSSSCGCAGNSRCPVCDPDLGIENLDEPVDDCPCAPKL